jgi:hypothetical protein
LNKYYCAVLYETCLAGITRNISQTANKESVHYIHSYSVKHSVIMIITPSIMKHALHFWQGLFILIPQSKYQKTSNFAEMGIFFHCKPSLFPTEQYKQCRIAFPLQNANHHSHHAGNRTLVHPGRGVRYCIGGCMSMGGPHVW